MYSKIKEDIWKQFGASIDMLIAVISECPDNHIQENKRIYYLAFHSAVFLDYYLTIPPDGFSPVLPFTLVNNDERPKDSIGDLVPDKLYSKSEIIGYLESSRVKCKSLIDRLTDEEILNLRFTEGSEPGDMDYSVFEILLYNLRHTQHHVGQLNLLIRQGLDKHMPWIFRADDK